MCTNCNIEFTTLIPHYSKSQRVPLGAIIKDTRRSRVVSVFVNGTLPLKEPRNGPARIHALAHNDCESASFTPTETKLTSHYLTHARIMKSGRLQTDTV